MALTTRITRRAITYVPRRFRGKISATTPTPRPLTAYAPPVTDVPRPIARLEEPRRQRCELRPQTEHDGARVRAVLRGQGQGIPSPTGGGECGAGRASHEQSEGAGEEGEQGPQSSTRPDTLLQPQT